MNAKCSFIGNSIYTYKHPLNILIPTLPHGKSIHKAVSIINGRSLMRDYFTVKCEILGKMFIFFKIV